MNNIYEPIDLSKIRTFSIKGRKSKSFLKQFAKSYSSGGTFSDFLSTLPKILAGETFREIVSAIVFAHKKKKPVIFAMGAHPIKCGLSSVFIELMKKRVVTAIALNGGGIIHDVEIALFGHTSENVEETIKNGSFGMTRETAHFINRAINKGHSENLGIGEAVGRELAASKASHNDHSLLAAAYNLHIPLTVHVAIGTDTIHMHPSANGEAIGAGSLKDFRIFANIFKDLGGGGVILNLGSAVILPEVILKAISLVKNLGYDLNGYISVDMDLIQHYRTTQQLVRRPKYIGGKGYALSGHHEIMIPLLAAAVLEKIEKII